MDPKTIETYNTMAAEYDVETADFWERFPHTILDEFTKCVGKGRVADIGSGPGRGALLLQKSGCQVRCLDASQAMVDICLQKGLDTVKGDLIHTSFKDSEFDGVWAYTSLLHIPKSFMNDALQEMSRILKPKGVLLLGLIEGQDEAYRTSSGVNRPRLFAYYMRSEIEQLLTAAGFDIEYFESFKPASKVYLNYILRKRA